MPRLLFAMMLLMLLLIYAIFRHDAVAMLAADMPRLRLYADVIAAATLSRARSTAATV